jgi:hypothetical protein
LPKPIARVSIKTGTGIYMVVRDIRNVDHAIAIMEPEGLKQIRDNNQPRPASAEVLGETKAA